VHLGELILERLCSAVERAANADRDPGIAGGTAGGDVP
jgi:hypothetical protein